MRHLFYRFLLAAFVLSTGTPALAQRTSPVTASFSTSGLCVLGITCSVSNLPNVYDGSTATSAMITENLSAIGGTAVRVTYGSDQPATTYAAFEIGAAELASLLPNLSITTYDALNNPVETSGSVGVLNLLTGPSSGHTVVYFQATQPFRSAQLNVQSLVTAVGDYQIYEAFTTPSLGALNDRISPTTLTFGRTGTCNVAVGGVYPCNVSNLPNGNDGNAATSADVTMNVAAVGGTSINAAYATTQPSGTYVAFEITSSLLAQILTSATITTHTSGGALVETSATPVSYYDITTGTGAGHTVVYFITTQPFAEARLNVTAPAAVASDYQLYEAFVANSLGALPVELTAFRAQADGEDALLAWETASETNNAGFTIEQQAGAAWQELGFVQGRGTSVERMRYSYRVADLPAGVHRFRLRQVDFDGTTSYSSAVEVVVGAEAPVALSMQGARMRLAVQDAQALRVDVYNAAGQRVARLFDGWLDTGTTVDAALPGGLAAGVYVVRAMGARGHAVTTALVQ